MNNGEFIFTDKQLTVYNSKNYGSTLLKLGILIFLSIPALALMIHFQLLDAFPEVNPLYFWMGLVAYSLVDVVLFYYIAQSISRSAGKLRFSIDSKGVILGQTTVLSREDIGVITYQQKKKDEFIGFYREEKSVNSISIPDEKISLGAIDASENEIFTFLKKTFDVPIIQPGIFKNYYFEQLEDGQWDWVSK